MKDNGWNLMKACVLISISDLSALLLASIREYWQAEGTNLMIASPYFTTSNLVNANGVPISTPYEEGMTQQLIITMITELFTEKQTDLRNSGSLSLTEDKFKQLTGCDERSAHLFAERLFSELVDLLGMHMPKMTFSNHDGYGFRFVGRDILIYQE